MCSKCNKTLGDTELIVLDDLVFCKNCADLPKCEYCHEIISENYLLANEKHWHKYHFYCQSCNKLIENKEFFVKNDQIICELCKNFSSVQEVPNPIPSQDLQILNNEIQPSSAEAVPIQEMQTFGEKNQFYTLQQLKTKPYPSGIDIVKREVNFLL